jgi:hypothetical protein
MAAAAAGYGGGLAQQWLQQNSSMAPIQLMQGLAAQLLERSQAVTKMVKVTRSPPSTLHCLASALHCLASALHCLASALHCLALS